jgi:SAM-dependent methyltransferase
LDVGTGRGRHARVLARRGYRVTGLDLSPRAIATARGRAESEGLGDRARFVVGDMREPAASGAFDGVVNLFSTFGYFEEEADHGRAVRAMAGALRPGGWLVQDLLNPAYLRARLVPRDERTVALPPGASGGSLPPEADALRIVQERRLVDPPFGGLRVQKTITLQPLAGGAPEAEPAVFTESVRLLSADEMRGLYRAAGLRVAALYGDYDGAPHAPEAPRLILHGTTR